MQEGKEKFVETGEADDRLTGDARFVAMRMGVKCPPRQVQSKMERLIFNNFLELNSNYKLNIKRKYKM